jgi:hypothetical protein
MKIAHSEMNTTEMKWMSHQFIIQSGHAALTDSYDILYTEKMKAKNWTREMQDMWDLYIT